MKRSTTGHLNASTQRTLDLLATTILDFLKKTSLEKIAIIDICRESNVPRATFYNHFEDKYDLLRYALRQIATEIRADIPKELSTEEKVKIQTEHLIDFAEKHYMSLKKISSANYNSILFSEVKDLFYDELLNYLDEMKSEGKDYAADTHIMAEFFSNAIVYSAKTWLENDMSTPREKIIDTAILMIKMK